MTPYEIPLRRKHLALLLARAPAASLDPQKFDYVRRTRLTPLRMTHKGIFLTEIIAWTVEDAGPYNLRRALGEKFFKMLSSAKTK